jgi:hypothetical protein
VPACANTVPILEALVAAGCDGSPLVSLRFQCAWCGSTRIDAVMMSKDGAVVPW